MEALRERVDHRDADAVQAAGDLVAAAVAELAAGVQGRHHDLGRRSLLLLVLLDRDAAAVVDDGDAVVGVDRDLDRCRSGRRSPRRPSCPRPRRRGGAGRVGRSSRCTCRGACGRLEALEDGDVPGAVAAVRGRGLAPSWALSRPASSPRACFLLGRAPSSAALVPSATQSFRSSRHGPGPEAAESGRCGACVQVHIRIPGNAGGNRADNATKSLQITHKCVNRERIRRLAARR